MIIAISGATASGKTTLAQAIAARTGGTAASFGDYVRSLVSEQGRAADRPTLQSVGQAAVEASAEQFLADFLRWTRWTGEGMLVLDGLRHASIRDALRARAERARTELRLVHIDADPDDRSRRLRARGDDDAAIAAQDAHSSERDVYGPLRDEADIRIERTDDVAVMSERVEAALGLTVQSQAPIRQGSSASEEAPS